MYSSIGVSSLTNYLNPRDNWLNYPPPSLRPDNNANHVVMAATVAAEKSTRCSQTTPNYQPFDDYLGLSKMLQSLTVSEPIPMMGGHRARLGSDGSEVFDDFRSNGVDAELDEFDRIIHRLRSEDGSPPPTSSTSASISPASASPPTTTLTANLAVLELLRERERRAAAAAAVQQQQQQQQQASLLPPLPPAVTTPLAPTRSAGRRARHGSGGSGGSGGAGQTVCVFCRNNGEPVHVYTAHFLKDQAGRVTCPILRAYKCPYCRASGDNAHTKTYCPLAINALGEAPLSAERVLVKHTTRSSVGKKRRPVTGGSTTSGFLNAIHVFD